MPISAAAGLKCLWFCRFLFCVLLLIVGYKCVTSMFRSELVCQTSFFFSFFFSYVADRKNQAATENRFSLSGQAHTCPSDQSNQLKCATSTL